MKLELKTILLIIIVLGALATVIIVAQKFILSSNTQPQKSPLTLKTQKKTYSNVVSLNGNGSPTAAPTIVPTDVMTVTPSSEQTETPASISPTEIVSPSPTEIVVASLAPTSGETTGSAQLANSSTNATAAPTTIAALPTTGQLNSTLIIFAASLSMILFAFVL